MSNALDNLVVVPDGDKEKLGIQLHWRLAGEIPQEELNQSLLNAGLPSYLLPTPPGDGVVLKRAMLALKRSNRDLIRSLSRQGGYSLVQEDASALDLEKNGGDEYDPAAPDKVEDDLPQKQSHTVSLTAKVVTENLGSGSSSTQLRISPLDHPLASLLAAEFDRQRGVFECSSDLSVWLTQKIVPHCNGLSARERGGFYYIPAGEDVRRFLDIASSVEQLSVKTGPYNKLEKGVKFYKVPAMMSGDVVEAMLDSLIDECDKVCDSISERIDEHNSGKKAFRKKGLRAHQDQAKQMSAKVKKYAKLLDTSLDDLHSRLEEVTGAIVTAELSLQDQL